MVWTEEERRRTERKMNRASESRRTSGNINLKLSRFVEKALVYNYKKGNQPKYDEQTDPHLDIS